MLLKGSTLKSWVIGEKLGSGACSDVYVVSPLHDETNDAYAMKVSPLPEAEVGKKKRKKTHAHRSADALYAEHLLYVNTLPGHDGIPSLPATGAYGEDKGHRFLVIERLGRNLQDVKNAFGSISESTAARVGLEILSIFRHLHNRKLIFVDVKPDNFMVGRNQEDKIYCVDFGIAERYQLVTGAHKVYKTGGVVGTPTFLSLNCHSGSTPSRRDDIEALIYVCIYLARGNLPWQNATSDADGAKQKRETPLSTLCEGLSDEWSEILTNIRACSFEEEPDYNFFEQKLKKLAGSRPLQGVFQWTEGDVDDNKPKKESAKRKQPKKSSTIKQQVDDTEAIETRRNEAEEKPTKLVKRTTKQSTKTDVIELDDEEDDDQIVNEVPKQSNKSKIHPNNTVEGVPGRNIGPAPSKRRVEAATRAVGAAAAANAAASIARRTRSSTKLDLQ